MARSQAPPTTLAKSHFLPKKSFSPTRGAGAAASLGGQLPPLQGGPDWSLPSKGRRRGREELGGDVVRCALASGILG